MAQQRCLADSGNPVLPTSSSLQCGLQSVNITQLEPCCKGKVKVFDTCFLYCEPKKDLQDFVTCVSPGTSAAALRTDAFCQRNVKAEIKQSPAKPKSGSTGTSSAIHAARLPSIPMLLTITLLIALLLVAPASASDTNNNLEVRAISACKIAIDSHYNQTTASTLKVSSDFDCTSSQFCAFGGRMDTGMTGNNRTLNGTSAASTQYDAFFELLGNSTSPKRSFPAMSGLSVWYGWAQLAGTTASVGFTPVQYCVNGTVSNCAGTLAQSNGKESFVACGPEFRDGSGLNGDDVIQGVFAVIVET